MEPTMYASCFLVVSGGFIKRNRLLPYTTTI